jgi:hypothetical protein
MNFAWSISPFASEFSVAIRIENFRTLDLFKSKIGMMVLRRLLWIDLQHFTKIVNCTSFSVRVTWLLWTSLDLSPCLYSTLYCRYFRFDQCYTFQELKIISIHFCTEYIRNMQELNREVYSFFIAMNMVLLFCWMNDTPKKDALSGNILWFANCFSALIY